MSNAIGKSVILVVGIFLGILLRQPGDAQENAAPGLRLSHVGINAKDFDESLRFYTQKLGFRKAFLIKDKKGRPWVTYLQIGRDTFLELAPAGPKRPPGVSHIAIWPNDLDAYVAALRRRGLDVADPESGSTKTRITAVVDPDGVPLELVDFLPDSLPIKAIKAWQ